MLLRTTVKYNGNPEDRREKTLALVDCFAFSFTFILKGILSEYRLCFDIYKIGKSYQNKVGEWFPNEAIFFIKTITIKKVVSSLNEGCTVVSKTFIMFLKLLVHLNEWAYCFVHFNIGIFAWVRNLILKAW